MPRMHPSGDVATGTGCNEVGINGAVPAALAAITGGGGRFGPPWFDATHILFQDCADNKLYKYDTVGFGITLVDARGENDVVAGNSVYAAFLAGTGVYRSPGATLSQASLGDVDELGNLAVVTYYQLGRNLSIYNSAGVQLSSVNASLFYPVEPFRTGVLAYSVSAGGPGWRLVQSTGLGVALLTRTDPLVNWMIPVATTGLGRWVVERTESITIRPVDSGDGYDLTSGYVSQAFNPDAFEISPNVVRVCWTTTSGEDADTLILIDVDLTDGSNLIGVVSGGVIVWTPQADFPLQTFATGTIVTGSGSGGGSGGGTSTRGGVLATRAVKATPPPPVRTYPEVDRITESPAAQRSLRLLWDKVYDIHETLQSTNTRVDTIQSTHLEELQNQVTALGQQVQTFAVTGTGGGSGGGGGGGKDDGGEGDRGCGMAGANGHVAAGSPLTRETAGKICCGTGNEFPSLLAIVVDQPTRDANRFELLGRMIWHLNLAGFTNVSRYPGNPFTLLIEIGGLQNAYRVTDYATFDVTMFTCMVFGGTTPSPTTPDAGIPD